MNSVTIRTLLVRGMLAGLAAGVVALVVAFLLGEPRVDAAIAFEEAHSHGHGHEVEVVSRGMQSTAGLATGVLVYGVALGGIAALVFCFMLGRIGRFGARTTAALLAGAALLVYLVPFLKYPANPPAVGDPDTIGQRTALYFLMMLLGILLAVGATILGRRLAPKLGNWYATVAAGAAFVVAVGIAYAFLPSYDNVPHGFPGTLLWQFRVTTIAIQLVLWTAFGLVFGHLAERVVAARPEATTAEAVPATS
ncbi:CbtA family protein [Streptomyces sp. MCA2]|uniref:CbtA family protein n=1 Tax=Streptomyces sp. MCA2 TaxID=2944805 RepID=UPI00202163C4|nr:CbtA family protein [Streptomyces sp. MCA2]MCL7493014.1 CbtA family protein [Streptomyces sp. MCA2]